MRIQRENRLTRMASANEAESSAVGAAGADEDEKALKQKKNSLFRFP